MNTVWADAAGVHDDLTTATALRRWLIDVGGFDLGNVPTPPELTEARILRDSLRRLAAFVTDDNRRAARSPVESADAAVAMINDMAADQARVVLLRRTDKLHRESVTDAAPVRTALAAVAGEAIELLAEPAAGALRACHAPHCVLYFVKTHPRREWCSEACGNRVRAARHYRRVRAGRQ